MCKNQGVTRASKTYTSSWKLSSCLLRHSKVRMPLAREELSKSIIRMLVLPCIVWMTQPSSSFNHSSCLKTRLQLTKIMASLYQRKLFNGLVLSMILRIKRLFSPLVIFSPLTSLSIDHIKNSTRLVRLKSQKWHLISETTSSKTWILSWSPTKMERLLRELGTTLRRSNIKLRITAQCLIFRFQVEAQCQKTRSFRRCL